LSPHSRGSGQWAEQLENPGMHPTIRAKTKVSNYDTDIMIWIMRVKNLVKAGKVSSKLADIIDELKIDSPESCL
jgi:hypothetical protein